MWHDSTNTNGVNTLKSVEEQMIGVKLAWDVKKLA